MASNYQLFVAGAVLTAAQVNTDLQRQVVIQCDAAADRTALPSVEGMMAYQKDTDALWIQSPAGTWVQVGGATTSALLTYTPQVDQGATTNISKTVTEARYLRTGTRVDVWVNLSMTGAGTGGSVVSVTLPVAPSGHTAGVTLGAATIYDTSASTVYTNAVQWSSGSLVLFANDASGGAQWGQTPNVALASGDAIRFQASYTV